MTSNGIEIRKIDSLLSEYLSPNTKILKHETRMLTAPGENYGSVMLAVDVTIQELGQSPKTLHLVAKLRPANEMLCDMFNIQQTFKKELDMYMCVIPTLNKFQVEHGTTDRKISDLFAECYGGRLNLKQDTDFVDEDAVLLLENLKIIGYDVEDRLIGFDKEHVYRILEDLARFHAIPIAFKVKKPEEFNKFIKPIIKGVKIGDGIPEEAKNNFIKEFNDILKDIEECKPYLDKIAKSVEDNIKGCARLLEPTEPFATIIHTDYWVNNTMILKDDDGKPIRNKIVDLQLPAYNTGAMDLIFFLYSSIKPDILYNNIDTYIKFYYDCFIECLNEFDIDIAPFCWENFEKEVQRVAIIELGHILVMYKPILTKRGTIDDMSNLNMDSMVHSDQMSSDYHKRIIDCVLSYIDRKWL